MHLYFFNQRIPSYGLCIVIGGIISNSIALFLLHKNRKNIDDFILLEAFSLLGSFIGAKGLYLFISFKYIDWSRIFDTNYFTQLMEGGFVFYGGLIGGLISSFFASKIYNINWESYINELIFLIPFGHAFGRIGCFLAGCCYGIPYAGRFAVTFPDNSFAPSGVQLFPVQLVEAIALFIISLALFFIRFTRFKSIELSIYFILYGILRSIIEKYRYDSYRGIFLNLSTSQWISLILIVLGLFIFYIKYHRRKEYG